MLQFLNPTARGLAAATIVSALAFAMPLYAATPDQPTAAPLLLAESNPAPSSTAPSTTPAPSTATMANRVEAHIKHLHDQLKITPAQDQQWNAVADVMRSNASAMHAAIEQRREAKNLSAVEDLKAYEAITEVHAQGLQKLIPPFQTLYDSLSPDQKKLADASFSRSRHGHHHHRMGTHAGESAAPSDTAPSTTAPSK